MSLKVTFSLCASPALAPFTLPFLLDKLSASSLETKQEVLITLVEVSRRYSHAALRPFLPRISTALEHEILTSNDSAAIERTLTCYTDMLVLLEEPGVEPVGHTSPVQEFLSRVLRELPNSLQSPETKAAQALSGMAIAAARASQAAPLVVGVAIPGLLNCYHTLPPSCHPAILTALVSLLQATQVHPGQLRQQLFAAYVPDIVELLDAALEPGSHTRLSALAGKRSLYHTADCALLSRPQEIGFLRQLLFLIDQEDKEVREAGLGVLESLVAIDTEGVETEVVSPLLNNLTHLHPQRLAAVAALAHHPTLFLKVFPVFATELVEGRGGPTQGLPEAQALAQLAQANCDNPALMAAALPALPLVLESLREQRAPLSIALLDTLCSLFSVVTHFAPQTEEWVESAIRLAEREPITQSEREVYVLLGVVVAASNKIVLLPHLGGLCMHPSLTTYASVVMAALVNKFPEQPLASVAPSLFNSLESQRSVTCEPLVWVSKGLLMRGFRIEETAGRLARLLSDPHTGSTLADAFGILFTQHPLLDKKFGCNVRLLYKQHVFDYILPKLQAAWEVTGAEVYLVALGHLLPVLPIQILRQHVNSIALLTVAALSSTHSSLQYAVLGTLKMLFKEAPRLLENHLNDLVPPLVLLAQYAPTVDARRLGVECVGQLLSLSHQAVFPHALVLHQALKVACDDNKRPVRQAAQLWRNRWLLTFK